MLTYSRTLDVRPSALSRKYTNADLDFHRAGQELHVATVLTGHFLKQENHLLITFEAIDTDNDRMMWQDRGELSKAYDEAAALVKRRPESAQARSSPSYVLRYAGMLEESARQCETAVTLTSGSYLFRSCAWAFMELGRFERAQDFIRFDAGSE